jgi:multidrug efflux pump subunit AcrB
MNFSAWAIRNPVPVILLYVLVTVAGIVGFVRLPVQDMPDLDFPMVTVVATLPGATPASLETEVTRKIEDSIGSISGVKHITSTVNDGVSVTMIEFTLEKNLGEAVEEVRNAVDAVRNQLPNAMPPPVVSRINVFGGAVLSYAVESVHMDEAELSWFVDNDISKSLLSVKGVGAITRFGGIDREVRVELDPTRLLSLGVTASEISSQLLTVQQEAPGGRTNLGGLEQSVRTIGKVKSVADIAALQIPLRDGRHIRLDAVATVHDTFSERRQLAFVDGKPAITFQLQRTRGGSEVAMAENVRTKIAELARTYPNVRFRELNNTTGPVLTNYKAALHSLIEGAILAVVVVWFFLREWNATWISAITLPLSIIPTFGAIQLLGFQLNIITLLAFTLVIGVLVDDAIVEVENIVRHMRGGKSAMEASFEAVKEIGLAVIATSLTLVAVFLPTAFMTGIPGRLFKQFGWTAAISVLFSLMVARLLTPILAAYSMKAQPEPEKDGRLMQAYLRLARWCLAHPGRSLGAALVFLVLSAGVALTISQTFMSVQDMNRISLSIEAPPGSNIGQTAALAETARHIIAENPEVLNVYTMVGSGVSGGLGGGSAGSDVRRATLVAPLTPVDDRKRSQQQIERVIAKRLHRVPGARFTMGDPTTGSAGQFLSLAFLSDDQPLLLATTNKLMAEMRALPDLGNIKSSAGLLRPEVIIRPDFARAAELGVSAATIGEAVRVATTSDYDQILPRLNLPARQLYIRTQFAPDQRGSLDLVRNLRVLGRSGAVPLSSVATITIEGGPAQIDRLDRSRNITLQIELQGRPVGDVLKEINTLPTMRKLPTGVFIASSGDTEIMAEMFTGFILAMGAGVFCVFAVLVLLFHDFLQPMTILAALPLSLGGAFGALALFGYDFSISSLIGLVMLMGIVTKNSILLVEYAVMARREFGMGRTEAILDACHKRARPIVMTTIAMVAGMMPMALALEGSSSARSPMAVGVIGGLITSTGLSLLIVPVIYELIDEFKVRLRHRFGHKNAASPMGGEPKPAAVANHG